MSYSNKRTLKQYIREYVPAKVLKAAIASNQPIDKYIKQNLKRCTATNRDGTRCKMKVVPGKNVCKMHGGLSTGPKTKEGKQKALANLKQYASGKAKLPKS